MTDVKAAEPVTQQPPAQAQPSYKKYSEQTGTEEWQNDIFDCFEGQDNLCLKGTFCSCFVYGKTQARIRDPTLTGYDRFNNDCIIFGAANACCGLGWVLQFIKRGEIRQKYSIRGDAVTDCLLSAFCGCCSIIQDEKEVIAREAQAGSAQGYVAPTGMSAAPQ